MTRGQPYRDRVYRNRRERILRDSDICHICGRPGADSVDHIIPLAKGGTNAMGNLKPAHLFPCNRSKSDKDHSPIVKRSETLA